MNGLGVRHLCRADNRRYVQIALACGGGPDADGLIRELHVFGLGIGFRVHDYGPNPQFTTGSLNPKCYLAPVGDQDLPEHRHQAMMKSGWPYSTGWPFSTRIALTVPVLSHSISFISFIASMMQMIWPSLTL